MSLHAKILVVDNEIDICNFVKSFFELRGFRVITATNGDEAMVRMQEERPEIVILDMVMRRQEEGLEYLEQIKRLYPEARVLMVTGIDDLESMHKAKSLGACDYITKPLVLENLEQTVMTTVTAIDHKKGNTS